MDIYAEVATLMTPNPKSVKSTDSLAEVKEIFDQHSFHHLPVVDEGKIAGMISKSDLLLFLRKKFSDYDDLIEKSRLNAFQVKDIMTTGVAKISPKDHIATALLLFKENMFHAVPVADGEGALVGIITTYDIISSLLDKRQ